MTEIFVTVTYKPRFQLGPTEIAYPFGDTVRIVDCVEACPPQISDPSTCCGSNSPGTDLQNDICWTCSCQNKSVSQCGLFACGESCTNTLFPPGCGPPATIGCCPCVGRMNNQPVFGDVVSVTVTCPEALALMHDGITPVLNGPAILNQCNPEGRIQCCKGDPTLGEGNCGNLWGPNNITGDCDQIMLDYCTANQGDSLCTCITPVGNIPVPECQDSRCKSANTMKLSKQLKNKCNGVQMTCIQFFDVDPGARNNVVNNVHLQQTCNVCANLDGTITEGQCKAAETASTTYIIIFAVIIVALVIAIVIGVTVKVVMNKKKRDRENKV